MDKYQTIGARFWATIVDFLATLPFMIAFIYFSSKNDPNTHSVTTISFLGTVLFSILSVLYYVLMHARYGQTLGKMAAKVKVLDISENPINLGQAIIRSLPQLVPLFLVIGSQNPQFLEGSASEADKLVMPYVAGITTGLIWIWNIADIIVALSNSKHRALHDYIAGTVVVKL